MIISRGGSRKVFFGGVAIIAEVAALAILAFVIICSTSTMPVFSFGTYPSPSCARLCRACMGLLYLRRLALRGGAGQCTMLNARLSRAEGAEGIIKDCGAK